MKVLRSIGICVLCFLVMLGAFLSLSSALLRFLVFNPVYLKTFVPSKTYCSDIREHMKDNLDYITILYGVDAEVLSDVVTDQEIENYYALSVDSLFKRAETTVPSYPKERFAAYLSDHTAYSSQAISDFSEDCAVSVTADLSSLNNRILVSAVSDLLNSRLIRLSPILCLTSVILVIVLIAMIRAVSEENPVIGRIAVSGGMFIGFSAILVPSVMFWLFDYVNRLNLPISAFRTALTASANTILLGCISVSGTLALLSFIILLFSCVHAAHKKSVRRKPSR